MRITRKNSVILHPAGISALGWKESSDAQFEHTNQNTDCLDFVSDVFVIRSVGCDVSFMPVFLPFIPVGRGEE